MTWKSSSLTSLVGGLTVLMMAFWMPYAASACENGNTIASLEASEQNAQLSESELIDCFWESFSSEPDVETQKLVTELWGIFSPEDQQRALWLFTDGLTAMEAIATVAANNDIRTEPVLRIVHAKAIDLWKNEYIDNMTTQDPLFTEWRWANLSEAEKEDRAAEYFDDIMTDFLTGNDNDSLEQFADYAPSFAQYVATFPQDFPLAEELILELKIDAEIAYQEEQNAYQEEQNAYQEELERLIDNLWKGG